MAPRRRAMLPTNSVAKGAKLMRGKRSGVTINARDVPASTDGGVLDDMDEMFNAAKTPSPETNASNRQKSSAAGRTRSSSNRKKAVRTNRAAPRMSLPNSRREGEDELDNDIDRKISGRSSASRYSARAKRNNFRRNGFSPSDMSSVSTAPETPRYPDENVADGDDAESPTQFDTHVDVEEQDEEMEVEEDIQRENSPARNDSSSSNENTDTESREPFPTPRAKELDHDAEEDEQVAEVAHGRTSRRHGLQAQAEDFPTDQEEGRKDESLRNHIAGDLEDTEDDDDAGDLLPPGPPEESSLEGDSTTPKTLPPGSDKVPFKSNEKSARFYDASDDDEDKEGHGYQMVGIDDEEEDSEDMNLVHDPETPKSVRRERAHRERQKIDAHARKERDRMQKKKKGSKRRRKEGDESSSSGEDDDSPVHSKKTPKTKKKTTFAVSPQGYQVDNREYETIPLSDLVEESPTDGTGVRRSRRARCRPLEYWRNEKLVYGAHNESGALGEAMGDMPVVTGVQKALKTPYKKRAVKIKKEEGHQGQTKMQAPVAKSSSRNDDEDVEFDYRKLKRKGEIMEDETARIWDDSADDAIDVKVVSYVRRMESSELPISKSRTKEEGKISGLAAQAFNIPNDDNDNYVGYIMGNLELPPRGIKDAESVGPCSQTFTVCSCQPRALEVAYGDPDQPEGVLNPETAQRFYLGPGDLFRVPPGNCYRLENHSKTTKCILTWTIIRPSHHHID